MTSKAFKAQKRMERAALAVGCIPESIDWMECALDPFPDEARKLAGYPDMVSGKSVVQAFRQQMTVLAPASASGGNWDCNIIYDGIFNGQTVKATAYSGNSFATAGQTGSAYGCGGLSVRSGPANAALPITTYAQQLSPVVNFAAPMRVIAQGFEVWNTTAPLYRQGNCVVWRQPREAEDLGLVTISGSSTAASQPMTQVPTVPENVTDALQLQGSLSWAAEKGVYAVGTLCQQDIPLFSGDFASSFKGLFVQSGGTNYTTPATALNTWAYFNNLLVDSSFNQFGAFFTGLSNQTSLTVVWHYVVERFPPATATDLVTMASNSCPYDPKALELYSRTAYHLPVGVWVEENGLGDWICDVADVLGTFGVPGMGIVKGVTRGIQGISNAFDQRSGQGVMTNENAAKEKPPRMEYQQKQAKRMAKGAQREARGKVGGPKEGPLMPNGKFKQNKKKKKNKK